MITILGSTGFIGRHLTQRLSTLGQLYNAPSRDADLTRQPLGNVIYCIGLTADFRKRPFDTVEAHVTKLTQLLHHGDFESLLYLSTTRIYKPVVDVVTEASDMLCNPHDPNDLYNISKIMGESIAMSSGRKVRIARISNVYGDDWTSPNFLFSLIKDAITQKHIHLRTSIDSNKDYISIDDVVNCLLQIAQSGRESVYNLASGINTSHETILTKLQMITGCTVTVETNAPCIQFPQIQIERLRNEFNFQPRRLDDDLPTLVQDFEQNKDKWQ